MCISPASNNDEALKNVSNATTTSSATSATTGWTGQTPGVARLLQHRRPLPLSSRRAVTPPLSPCDSSLEHRVSFGPNQVFEVDTTLSCLADHRQERRQLWYTKKDISGFRREAQIASKKLREQALVSDSDDSDSDDDEAEEVNATIASDNDYEYCTRGLELRASPQRQDRKQQVVRRVLAAQDPLKEDSAERMARIAREHSIASRQLAAAQAHQDYLAAYHPNLSSTATTTEQLASFLTPSIMGQKRSLWATKTTASSSSSQPTNTTGRRVRCRMY